MAIQKYKGHLALLGAAIMSVSYTHLDAADE